MRGFFRSMRLAIVMLAACATLSSGVALAATTSSIVGTVRGPNGAPIAGANVTIVGVVRLTKTTDSAGSFAFRDITTGAYTVTVSKPGFQTYRNDGVTAFIGETTTLNVTLAQATFSSLKTIAYVSTSEPGVAQINKSTAAVNTIGGSVFNNQAQEQVTKVLNETPGIFTWSQLNAASPAGNQVPQIRGALPYETESLIDGHPVSVGSSGFYSPTLISPELLQDVELVKGPGSMPTEINYAIGGTVNYRTLEPTSTPHQSFSVALDKWGGIDSVIKATGSLFNHRVDYAAGYVTNGYPGPLSAYSVAGSQVPLDYGAPPWTIDGRQVATFPVGEAFNPSYGHPYAGEAGQVQFKQPLYTCCTPLAAGYHSTSELAKLRFNFSPVTALTVSYLGGQSIAGIADVQNNSLTPVGTNPNATFSTFAPCYDTFLGQRPCAYNGSVKVGTGIPYDIIAGLPGNEFIQQNLFQGEFRSAIGQMTVLARYYTGALNDNTISGQAAPTKWTLGTWGGIPLCPSGTSFNLLEYETYGKQICTFANGSTTGPTMTYFNGQPATYQTGNTTTNTFTDDHMYGESLLLSEPVGDSTISISYDRSHQASSYYFFEPISGIVGYQIPPSAGQTFSTYGLHGNIVLNSRLNLNLADYFIDYASHFTPNGGASYEDSSHNYNAPRAALTWQPTTNTSVRLAAGASIAPPYISLISSPGSTPQINAVPGTYYTVNANNGAINPETSWGYDLGADQRIARSTSVSVDLYQTTLRNMFLNSTSLTGTYKTLPLYTTETENLGIAQYKGIEATLAHVPALGLGWRVQASLQRAYTYDLPPFFYCGVPKPGCSPTTNLGVLPNSNFTGSGTGWDGVGYGIGGGVPYSQGYAELNFTGRNGQYYSIGTTYYGNNNGFNQPAFAIVSATARFVVGPGTHLQFFSDNLNGAYSNPYFTYFGGVPVPLATAGHQATGYLGATSGGEYGPTTFRIVLSQDF